MQNTLYDIHEYARDNMQAQIQRVKDRYDKKQYGEPFKKNDLVWKLIGKFEQGTRAFQRKYDGIYIVEARESNTSYRIRHVQTNKSSLCHFKRAYTDPETHENYVNRMENSSDLELDDEEALTGTNVDREEEPTVIAFRQQPGPLEPVIDRPQEQAPAPRRVQRRVRVAVPIARHNYNLRPRRNRA